MLSAASAAAVAAVLISSAALLAFGANLLFLTWRAVRSQPEAPPPPIAGGLEPPVLVQLPIYNERYVAARVIDSAAALDWPRERLRIQVLDDSDDDTAGLAAQAVARWRRAGVRIDHVRRGERTGYKAGALAHGLRLDSSPLVAVLDADFVVPRDFLRRLVPHFEDPEVGFVQARWGHLNARYSLLTRLQALAIDFHFMVEQTARSRGGFLTNFTGTAGIWRRAAIEDAGGWSAATLTEDLDLSYRAQLRGWRAVFRDDVEVKEELPVSIDGYRRQQARWATGTFQCAGRLLVPVLRSPLPAGARLQGAAHLLAYGVGPLMLLQLACYPVLLVAQPQVPGFGAIARAVLLVNLISAAPWAGVAAAQHRLGRRWWRSVPGFLCQVLGAGMSITVLRALVRALRGGGAFERTPKYRIEDRGAGWAGRPYARAGAGAGLVELVAGSLAVAVSFWALTAGQWLIASYSALFAGGMLWIGGLSGLQAAQVVTARQIGQAARRRIGEALPDVLLFSAAAALLGLALRLPIAFEDSYHHWLVAAGLAAGGGLRDPLFGMEDSWLPGYHLAAAGVLKVFGLRNLDALRAFSALAALVTLGCVRVLAGGPRRGRIAVALLALNPIFVLTATSAVAEPLLTALLAGAAVAWRRGRAALAAALACAAAATGTKAWVFVGGVAAIAALALARRRTPSPALRRLRWILPAVGAALALEGFGGFAVHSSARGALEARSAAIRGSVDALALARAATFAWAFLQASLPAAVLAAGGLLVEARTGAGRVRLAAVHAPSLLYLAATVTLVAAGAYTGSHRYYYPALPAVALLGAAALARVHLPIQAVGIGAAAAVAVAYVPVLQSLAGVDAPLERTGRALATVPGRLLTDSPVVAYWSGRAPSAIAGSRGLPSGRDAAIAWLRNGGYRAIALEDVDYYRATAVFPELLRGGGDTAPFAPAAGTAGTGGKGVRAYLLPPAGYSADLWRDVSVSVDPASQPAAGKTAPLQKGLVLRSPEGDLAGEGVGFGVPIVHYGDGWHYSRTATTVDLSPPGSAVFRKTFDLDMTGGDSARDYRFVPTRSRGRIEVTYRVRGKTVEVTARALRLDPGFDQVALLNEQSSVFDDFADETVTRTGTAFGSWAEASGPWARLRSGPLGIEWSVPVAAGARLYAGREAEPGYLDWAGLDHLYGPGGFTGVAYTITLGGAR